ncbi:MAG: P-loop NTPase fold protein, partial [Pseudomonadota bacterium]
MPPDTAIKWTYSVRAAVDELDASAEVSSWQIVQRLLQHHGEYGSEQGKRIAAGPGPSTPQLRPAPEWLRSVGALFDPELVSELHGRLLILGLCQLDDALKQYLDSRDFLRSLRDELREDFAALLLPEHAGDQAYRRTFLQVLQNKAKYEPGTQSVRRTGFVIVARGGPGLQDLAELCHHQTYNNPLSARYVLASGGLFSSAFLDDLGALNDGDSATIGSLLPDPATDLSRWRDFASNLMSEVIDEWKQQPTSTTVWPEPHEDLALLKPLADDKILPTGARLILLVEYRRVRSGASPESVGLTLPVLKQLAALPERVGIVLSGLPEGIRQVLRGPHVTVLDLPPDRQLTRGAALTNDVPAGPDRLNIHGEVNALAEAMALEDMIPPMVVAVMGGWGAGKSFVLHLIENRIQEIRCERIEPADPDGPQFPFVGHPYLIRFDAWTYAKGNLWASLMQQIFVELDRQIGLEQTLSKKLGIEQTEDTEVWRVLSRLSADEQDRLVKTDLGRDALEIVANYDRGQISESRLWQVLEQLKKEEIQELRTAEEQLERDRMSRDQARRALEASVDEEIERDARRAAWQAVGDEFLNEVWKARDTEGKDDAPTFAELQESISWPSKLLKEAPTASLALVLFVLAGAVVAWRSDMGEALGVGFAAAAGLIGSVSTALVQFSRFAADAKQRFETASSDNRRLAGREALMRDVVAGAATDGATTDATQRIPAEVAEQARLYKQRDEALERKRAEVEMRRQRVGMAGRHGTLLDFVQERLEGRFYEGKLGLLHQVKSDLEDLSDALLHGATSDLFPRGKPRIVLLIDDLDRCPPDKVVEVLEAAQLLVKTPLFVVVISMDVRYVTRALEKVYEGVL